MIKNRKKLIAEEVPEFQASIDAMPMDSKIFVDKSLEIADHISLLMESKGMKQKDLAEKLGKSEAEVSKILSGMQNLTIRTIAKLEAALEDIVVCIPTANVSFHMEKDFGTQKSFRSKVENRQPGVFDYQECKIVTMHSGRNQKTKSNKAI